jgi:UDP-N-acetylmuramoyl-L-alanyl-D-glutamate--2,6-diaminopimelate ligase
MKLGDLIRDVGPVDAVPPAWREQDVREVVNDSRQARPGAVFVAVRGFHSDGHRFVEQALRQGAVAAVVEAGSDLAAPPGARLIRVADSRAALAALAAAFYGQPSKRLRLVGITGTNGKTTTSYLIKSIIEATVGLAGLIGTIDYRIGDTVYPAPNTTPESLDLQRLLSEMVDAGAKHCVMEVSSHALALGRTAGCEFATAVFTNLTQDHLDFHRDMDDYFRAKLRLFTGLAPGASAVVNSDDPRAETIIGSTAAKVLTTGIAGRADVRPEGAVRHGISGLASTAATPAGPVAVESPLVGRHNVYNILSAIGAGVSLGFTPAGIARGIENMKAVPGRMEKVAEGQPFGVVVDYAHTEDALARLLEAVREIAAGRVITLFGCGGDRDRTKRPKMGAAALAGSDIVVVTSDNPRTEDPLAIIEEIETGMAGRGIKASPAKFLPAARNGRKPYFVIPDRREAIEWAVRTAGPGDVVVLAGKGHEDYQIVGGTKHHFDDREEARSAIKAVRGKG